MITEDKYQTASSIESWGSNGETGIRIQVAGMGILTEEMTRCVGQFTEKIQDGLNLIRVKNSSEKQSDKAETIRELLGCFPSPIWHREISNRYCSRYCCWHLPWLEVFTTVGPFVIGWRKRVIHLSWDDIPCKQHASELFASEDVTKGPTMIHAWSLERAKQYVETVIESVSA